MCRDPQEFVDDAVGQIPGVGGLPNAFQEPMGRDVLRRVFVGSIQQDVGVDDA